MERCVEFRLKFALASLGARFLGFACTGLAGLAPRFAAFTRREARGLGLFDPGAAGRFFCEPGACETGKAVSHASPPE